MTTSSKNKAWLLAVLVVVGAAGFAIGRMSSGIEHVSAREFLEYAGQIDVAQSAFDAKLIGTDGTRAYLQYWRGVRFLGPEHTVVWTSLSELPADIAQKLRDGQNPWSNRPANPK